MKAQMFIITMVFLVGLIFTVQAALSQYSYLDLAKAFKESDHHTLVSIKKSFEDAHKSSPECHKAEEKFQELEHFFEKEVVEGSAVEIDYSLDCLPKTLTLSIHLKSAGIDTMETLTISG